MQVLQKMPIRAYWTSCRISPGDCENTKHHHSCLQRLHRQPKQTRRDPNAWHPPSVGGGDGQQTVNTDQDKDLTPKPRPAPLSPPPHSERSRVTMVRGARHVPPIVGLHHRGSAAHTQSEVRCHGGGLRAEVTSQQLATL